MFLDALEYVPPNRQIIDGIDDLVMIRSLYDHNWVTPSYENHRLKKMRQHFYEANGYPLLKNPSTNLYCPQYSYACHTHSLTPLKMEMRHVLGRNCGEIAFLYTQDALLDGEQLSAEHLEYPDGSKLSPGDIVYCHNCHTMLTIFRSNGEVG